MGELDKIKKRIKEQAEENIGIDESDIPVHEKHVKEEHIKQLKKNKRDII